jgi:hypothetical protein
MMKYFDDLFLLKSFIFHLLLSFVSIIYFLINWIEVLIVHGPMDMVVKEGCCG